MHSPGQHPPTAVYMRWPNSSPFTPPRAQARALGRCRASAAGPVLLADMAATRHRKTACNQDTATQACVGALRKTLPSKAAPSRSAGVAASSFSTTMLPTESPTTSSLANSTSSPSCPRTIRRATGKFSFSRQAAFSSLQVTPGASGATGTVMVPCFRWQPEEKRRRTVKDRCGSPMASSSVPRLAPASPRHSMQTSPKLRSRSPGSPEQ
mmetsp:Transcript_46775/g.146582  ORF Transcript_46775/g.146582 Transcript_46775/m.146582 type:complete len:210 (+) Transcript_46775:170-799(+)